MSGKSLKVVVEINEAYPLLHSAFARIPANVRSERLRALAMIGMYLEGGSETLRGIPVNMGVVDGQLEPIQFAVFIGETQPKLLDQLSSISKRARAERLRILALLALYSETGKLVVDGSKPAIQASMAPEPRSQISSESPRSRQAVLPTNAADVKSLPKPVDPVKEIAGSPSSTELPPVASSTTDASNRVGKGVRSFARSLG
ncbi:hypothetical protein KW843_25890 [Acidovorax sp. sif1233]|jgi:hypothetical protein|uniref:hypothetical protein n=1 Tax=Acidovorax sp. sif1233 TaxID=2854792 RepID=UPI001C43FC75|nr:hypothetical protein [Acidovorax sp. sif1233]MBV7457932.1 hypothetical protein [Acidovorax sp. sif1233]